MESNDPFYVRLRYVVTCRKRIHNVEWGHAEFSITVSYLREPELTSRPRDQLWFFFCGFSQFHQTKTNIVPWIRLYRSSSSFGVKPLFWCYTIKLFKMSLIIPSGVENPPPPRRPCGMERPCSSGGPQYIQSTKIYYGFFQNGFNSSNRRLCSGSLLWNLWSYLTYKGRGPWLVVYVTDYYIKQLSRLQLLILDQVPLEHLTMEKLHWNFPALGLIVLLCITIPHILKTVASFSAKTETVTLRLLHRVPKYETVLLKLHFFQQHL